MTQELQRRTFLARWRATEGQSLVEFMLVITFLFFVFLGIIQTVMLMYAYSTLADAAKQGVRYAIVHGTGSSTVNGGAGCSGPGTTGPPLVSCADTAGNNVVNAVLGWGVGSANCSPSCGFANLSFQNVQTSEVTVDYNPNGANGTACNVPGCLVRVTVAHPYRPFFGLSWPSFTLYAAADGRIMN